jgi:hypothetical protein
MVFCSLAMMIRNTCTVYRIGDVDEVDLGHPDSPSMPPSCKSTLDYVSILQVASQLPAAQKETRARLDREAELYL